MTPQVPCTLELSNGFTTQGTLVGAKAQASGELVFTTAMVGYSETLTDPSYFGQMIVFSYPLIGNYGIPQSQIDRDGLIPEGFESERIHCAGAVIGFDSPEAFHWKSVESLSSWLLAQGKSAVVGVDTRHLVTIVRQTPNLLCRININGQEPRPFFDPHTQKLMEAVSTKERRKVGRGDLRIAVLDCGIKWNILRYLTSLGCETHLLPWNTDLTAIECDGWLLSNGPGNPENTGDLIARVAKLLTGDKPILGICLGHQILSLAAGAKIRRMPYGHRSHNQPVYVAGTRKGFITSQNHGYEVVKESLHPGWLPWFQNANDGSIEGVRHERKPFFGVQFHPEAAGGPRDTAWVLDEFVKTVAERKRAAH